MVDVIRRQGRLFLMPAHVRTVEVPEVDRRELERRVPGKPAQLPEALRDRVLELTLTEPPGRFGATHWSSRLLATALAGEGTTVSHATIARIWHRFGIQPWRAETFKFSTDPQLEGKIRDVVGLYLHPPEKAVVLCVDEKPQIEVFSPGIHTQ